VKMIWPPTFHHEILEPIQVEPIAIDPDLVATAVRQHSNATDLSAQARHTHLDRLPRRARNALSPQLVDESLRRDDLVRVHQKQRQQCSFLRTAHNDRVPVAQHFERAQDPELHTPLPPVARS
jgi:hypothetical protein